MSTEDHWHLSVGGLSLCALVVDVGGATEGAWVLTAHDDHGEHGALGAEVDVGVVVGGSTVLLGV